MNYYENAKELRDAFPPKSKVSLVDWVLMIVAEVAVIAPLYVLLELVSLL